MAQGLGAFAALTEVSWFQVPTGHLITICTPVPGSPCPCLHVLDMHTVHLQICRQHTQIHRIKIRTSLKKNASDSYLYLLEMATNIGIIETCFRGLP